MNHLINVVACISQTDTSNVFLGGSNPKACICWCQCFECLLLGVPCWKFQQIPLRQLRKAQGGDFPKTFQIEFRWCQIIPNHPKWVQMIPDDPWWTRTSPDEPRWSQLISDDLKWPEMIWNDPRWSPISADNPKWSQMAPADPKWSQMISDNPQCPQIIPDDPRWSQLIPSLARIIPDAFPPMPLLRHLLSDGLP